MAEEEKILFNVNNSPHVRNPDTTPTYLKKAGQASEALGDPARALKFYEQLKVRYGTSFPARDIDKFIAKVQQDLE